MSDLTTREIATRFLQKEYPECVMENGDINPNGWKIIEEVECWFEKPLADFINWLESSPNRNNVLISRLEQSGAKTFVDFYNLEGDPMECINNFVDKSPISETLKKNLKTHHSEFKNLIPRKSDDSDASNHSASIVLQLVVIANRCPPELQVDKPVINITQLKALISETRYFYCADQARYMEKNPTINWDMADDVVLTFSLTLSLAGADKLKTVKTRNNLKFALDDGVVEKIELTASDSYSQDPIALVESHGFKRA